MNLDYNITLQQEVLRELAADIHGAYYHYMEKHHINSQNRKNAVALLAKDVFKMKDEILGIDKTQSDLDIIRGKLREAKSVIERLSNESKQELREAV